MVEETWVNCNSASAYHRVFKLSRTISDLAGHMAIAPQNLALALQYKPRVEEDWPN